MKKICVVTGSRAEYGLLRPLIQKIEKDRDLSLQLIATGMHLANTFGLTYKEIEQDGYTLDAKIEMNLNSDTSVGICKSMGLGMMGFCEAYARLAPDMVVLLGDRYEIFTAASAAMISRLPIAHIHGGEITEGAYDDSMRHCVTKMSYLHFTSTESYRKRVIQLGETPERVYNVGALGVENIKKMEFLSQKALEEHLDFSLNGPIALVTFHPVTLEINSAQVQFQNILRALDHFKALKVVFTKANSDTDHSIINQMIDTYAAQNKKRAVAFTSLGVLKYLSLMKYSAVIIGNSSSGIIEAPSLKVPTVNIGDRQKGRVQARSIIHCDHSEEGIRDTIQKVLHAEVDVKAFLNPYEKEGTSTQIITLIKEVLSESINLKKCFYDLG
ncbi:UDP-N-acetylglucosamine 2-epimerase [Cellulosilyticum sp. I15G10I2]|uniref:UDP-N-acetylglucosamine 2-epimerase n=1 Tax=Cellulosilyticum sp. I15G10I2 TaxID=1892843 RepID=UPI00085CA8D5|nr:UDP-N-acetylglucosamine 2-epimerase [Cellulosilyticum sp. I15G10I2]